MRALQNKMPPKRNRNSDRAESAVIKDCSESDSDSEVDVDELLYDDEPGAAAAVRIVNAAALARVNPHTREAYDSNISQCARWALSSESFRNEVIVGQEHSLTLKWPLNQNMVIGFVDFLENKQIHWSHTNKKKHLSPSTIAHYFSAFKDLFNVNGQSVPDDLELFFSNTYRKYVLHISQMKLDCLYPDTTNSIGFSTSVYETICRTLVGYWTTGKGATNAAVRYMRLFFIFCYALLGRGERIGRLRFSWISWSDDSMMVKIPTSKSDQAGALSYSKRVYANSLNPSVCPILALAVEVFSRSCAPFSDRVFPSSDSNYHKTSHSAAFKDFLFRSFGKSGLGIQSHSITNHSAKRSGIMTVSNAEVIHWHSVELRADHKVGITSSYQTSAAPQQDGVMGRILSCLPVGDPKFNLAPPHFEPEYISHIQWTTIVPHYDSYESDFHNVIPFLFASLVHHWDWLQQSMPPDHPFKVSKLALLHNRLIQELKPNLLGGFLGAKSALNLTGSSRVYDMHIDIKATGSLVSEIHSVVCGGSLGCLPTTNGTGTIRRDQNNTLEEIHSSLREVLEQNKQILKISTAPAASIAIHAEGLSQRPVYYLPSSWRLINAIKPEGLFLKWFVPDGHICAWDHIQNSMLPMHKDRKYQQALLSKYRRVMQCLIGTTRTPLILRDVATSFSLCWDRMVIECGWTLCLKNDSCTTLYGKIPKEKMQHLMSTPVPGFSSNPAIFAAAMAVQAATMAQNAALAFASTAPVAQHANQLFQSVMQLAQDAIRDDDIAAEIQSDDSCDRAVIPRCIPRGAVMYPLGAPRPPIDPALNTMPVNAAIVQFNLYATAHSPRSGSVPCWVCPHCLTASSPGAFQSQGVSLRRHMRICHKNTEYNSNDFNDYLHRSQLLWCYKEVRGKSWLPVITQ